MSLYDFCERVKLGDLFECRSGVSLPLTKLVEGTKRFAIIRASDLASPQLSYEDFVRIDFEGGESESASPPRRRTYSRRSDIPRQEYLQPGDLVLPKVTRSPRCVAVPDDWGPCLPSHTVLVLRRKDSTFNPEPVRQYLLSKIGFEAIRQVSSWLRDSVSISPSVLQDLEIPLIPTDVQASLLDSEQMEKMIVDEGTRLRSLRESILSTDSEDSLRATLRELRGQLVAARLGVNQSSDLSSRILRFYPLPLAYPYRVLQAEHEKTRTLKQVFRVAEVQLAFLSSLCMALASKPQGKVKDRISSAWRGNGATFGNWLSVLLALLEGVGGNSPDLHRMLKEVVGDADKPTRFCRSIQWLNEQRNRFHHEDIAEGPELTELVKNAQDHLNVCFVELGFLMESEIVLVQDFDAARDRKSYQTKCLLYAGDHPACRMVERTSPVPLTKDDLYLVTKGSSWVSLFRFDSLLPEMSSPRDLLRRCLREKWSREAKEL